MRKIKSNTPEWGHSLHRMPWEMNHELTKTEQLISSTVEEWYAAKHRVASEEELSLINHLEIKACPHCGCDSFVKNGFYKSGMQRYKCNSCGHGFSPLTNTIFDSRKIRSLNGLNICFICLSFIPSEQAQEITETPIVQASTG